MSRTAAPFRMKKSILSFLALGFLSVQAAIDRVMGRPLFLGLGVDAPVTAATIVANADVPPAPAAAAPAAPAGAAPAAAAPLGLSGALRTALSAVRGRTAVAADLTRAEQQLATVTTERDTARTELATARTERDTATAQLTAFAAYFGIKPTELSGLTPDAATSLLTARVSSAATEQVAALGFNVSDLPAQAAGNGGGAAETLEEIQTQLAEAKTAEARGKLAAKANALREKAWAAGSN